MVTTRADTINFLRESILRMEGFKQTTSNYLELQLGPIRHAFPNSAFPLGAVHEFLSPNREQTSAATGFIAGLLSFLLGGKGACLWISAHRTLFPPALKSFGLAPDRFIFIDLRKEREVLWAMEEALKCGALAAVVGEVEELSFTASRRLQLCVERSKVTGFILRSNLKKLTTSACVARWQITSLPSELEVGLPGIGFPKWRVELLRVRNGKPGSWEIQWTPEAFLAAAKRPVIFSEQPRKAG